MSVEQAVRHIESDGKPMADNTKQARWIVYFFTNLLALYRAAKDVFVAANNLWFPLEHEESGYAPDVYVVFGRPKGDRSSYKQWEEGDIPLTVVFEILSPSNNDWEMHEKFEFYEEHGVQEYYIYDPETNKLEVYTRGPHGSALVRRRFPIRFTSPRMGITFDLTGELRVFYADGKPFLTFEELRDSYEKELKRAEDAETRATDAETRLARVIALGRKARHGTASPEELAELERLEA